MPTVVDATGHVSSSTCRREGDPASARCDPRGRRSADACRGSCRDSFHPLSGLDRCSSFSVLTLDASLRENTGRSSGLALGKPPRRGAHASSRGLRSARAERRQIGDDESPRSPRYLDHRPLSDRPPPADRKGCSGNRRSRAHHSRAARRPSRNRRRAHSRVPHSPRCNSGCTDRARPAAEHHRPGADKEYVRTIKAWRARRDSNPRPAA
jgi:hypothetical protein